MTATASNVRVQSDTFGPIDVPSDRYWGAQTQRSIENFRIGIERMPRPLIRAFGIVKYCSAQISPRPFIERFERLITEKDRTFRRRIEFQDHF